MSEDTGQPAGRRVQPDRTGVSGPAASAASPTVLSGRYLLEEKIASGGMATVWRAHDEVLARTVAVKILHAHLALDASFRERFRREAIAAAKLSHAGVVSLYDTGSDGDKTYLVMEYIDGVTLKDLLAEQGALPIGQACRIAASIATALDYAHQRGLVHRDVKPANILISTDGTVKIADFGIAKLDHGGGALTRTGMVMGSAAYVAPEQIRGEPLDGKADQYALGVMLYEALTGHQPFVGDSAVAIAAKRLERDPEPVRSRRSEIAKDLDAIVRRTLARRPNDRFPTTASLADRLASHAADDDATAALVTAAVPWADQTDTTVIDAPEPGPEPSARTGRTVALVLILLAVAGGLMGMALYSGAIDTPESFPTLPAREDTGDDAAEGEDDEPAPDPTVAPISVSEEQLGAFDPVSAGGDGVERDSGLPNLLDGDPSTEWRSDGYRTANLGNLKPGIGFTIDLGEPHTIERVELTSTTAGAAVEVRAAQQYSDDAQQWQLLDSVTDISTNTTTFGPDEPVTARHVLVYATNLPNMGVSENNPFHVGFSDVVVHGHAPLD